MRSRRMVKVTEPVDTIFVKSIVKNGPAGRAGLCVGKYDRLSYTCNFYAINNISTCYDVIKVLENNLKVEICTRL